MWRKLELIDWIDTLKLIAARAKPRRVACEAPGVAGHGDDKRNFRLREGTRLQLGSGTWRIEDNGIVSSKLQRAQRPPEQIAP